MLQWWLPPPRTARGGIDPEGGPSRLSPHILLQPPSPFTHTHTHTRARAQNGTWCRRIVPAPRCGGREQGRRPRQFSERLGKGGGGAGREEVHPQGWPGHRLPQHTGYGLICLCILRHTRASTCKLRSDAARRSAPAARSRKSTRFVHFAHAHLFAVRSDVVVACQLASQAFRLPTNGGHRCSGRPRSERSRGAASCTMRAGRRAHELAPAQACSRACLRAGFSSP